MAMTLMERANFRQKMQDEYGPGWEEIVTHYKQQVTPRSRHKYEDYKGWNVDPTRFRSDNPLSLLSSREDIDAVLNKPTKQDYINELDQMSPNRYTGDEPARSGQIGPQRFSYGNPKDDMSSDFIPRGPQLGEVSAMDQSLYFGGGHPDELSLAQAPQHYGYNQFTRRPPGLLDSGEGQFSQTWPGPSSDFPNRNMNTVGDIKAFEAAYNQPPGASGASTPGKSGWMSDERMLNAQNRKLRLAQMFLNYGEQSRNDDDGWGGPLTHYN